MFLSFFKRGRRAPLTSVGESAAGKSFIQLARLEAWSMNARAGWWMLFAFNAISIPVNIYLSKFNVPWQLILFNVTVALWSLLAWKSLQTARRFFFTWPMISCFGAGCYFLLMREQIVYQGEAHIAVLASPLAISMAAIMLMPGSIWNALFTAAFTSASAIWATQGYLLQNYYSSMFAIVSFGCVLWNLVSIQSVEQLAKSSLDMRITTAPAHIANQAINAWGVASHFPIEERHTAITVIKWSNIAFQSSIMVPGDLDKLLSVYLSLVDQILISKIPTGAWFADLIQHEIHIYLFAQEDAKEVELLAIDIAVELMRLRSQRRELDIMGFLDIGIGCGAVVSGIVGPKLYQKTTVIGQPVGSALAAKTLGVPLRNVFGGHDQILFGEGVAAKVEGNIKVTSFLAPAVFSGRKWNEQNIYVIDSGSLDEEVADLDREWRAAS